MSQILSNAFAKIPGAPGAIPTSFNTTAGNAVPALNILTLTNGNNFVFSGAGSAITGAVSLTPTFTTVYSTTFDTNVAAAGVTLAGTTLSADGTDANININITAKGTGQVIIDDLQLGTPLTVPYGGTGQATHTIHGVLIGNAAGAINAVADVANAGYILTTNVGADPSFQAPPPGVVYASDVETIAGTESAKAVAPSNLKAKLGTQTVHALPIGNSDSLALNWLAVGLNGQTIMGSTGADCGWTSSPQFGGSVTATNDINTTAGNLTASNGGLIASNNAVSTADAQVEYRKTRTSGIITSGDGLGTMRFEGYDGVSFISGSKITSTNTGTVAVNRIAGDLKFYTHPDSIIALPSEPLLRMTIDSTGAITAPIVYSTTVGATAGVGMVDSTGLLGTLAGTAGQILQGGTKPVFSTCTYPSTVAIGDVLVASAANVISALTGATTAGHVLMANGALASPTFQALPAGTGVAFTCDGGTTSSGLAQNLLGTANQITTTGNGTTTMTLSIPSSPSFGGTTTVATGLTATSGDITLTDGDIIITNKDVATTSPIAYFKKYRAAAALTTGDLVGTIKFGGYDGTQVTDGARITSTSSGTIASTRVAGDLKFYTHPDSAAADPTLRMTIASTGATTIASPDAGVGLTVSGGGITCTSGAITASSGDVIITSGNLTLPQTTSSVGQIKFNSNTILHVYGGEPNNDACRNLFLGKDAGNFTCSTATNNGANIGIGCLALRSLTGGGDNFALGYKAFNALQGNANNGYRNVAIGNYAGYRIVANGGTADQGSYNILIGYGSGGNLTGNEYNNIFLGNYAGVAGQNSRLQIGSASGTGPGQLSTAFIHGIYGVTPAGTINVSLVDSNGQLGSVASLGVANGGTGAATLTDHGILLGSGTGAITPLGVASNGQIPIGSAGADPVLATISSGSGIVVTNGAGTISIATSAGGMDVSESTTSNAVQMAVNTTYVATSTNGGTLVVYTLPATAAVGDRVRVIGKSTAFWKVAQNATDTIFYGAATSTPGNTGYATTAQIYASATFTCITASSIWAVTEFAGTITLA